MLFVKRPSPDTIERLLRQAREADLTYAEVGATRREDRPSGYRHDVDDLLLGLGRDVFDSAVSALRRWHAHLGAGIELIPHGAVVADGDTVLLLIRAAGLWTVAPSRVVYVADEPDSFRFAYGTGRSTGSLAW